MSTELKDRSVLEHKPVPFLTSSEAVRAAQGTPDHTAVAG